MFHFSPQLGTSSRPAPLAVDALESRIIPSATLPTGFEQLLVGEGFQSAMDLEILPDGRVLIVEQEGIIRVWKEGQVLAEPFLQLDVVTYNYSFEEEEGLMSVVADPNFATNQWIYVYHTVPDAGGNFNRVSRFTVVGDRVDPASRVTIFDTEPLVAFFAYHIGGAMKFGPDGKLYIAIGESGFNNRVQDMTSLYGKILRINKDGTIPTDNPFLDRTTGKAQAIYALGFRNPFKMSFQPGTNTLFVNDVGENAWEEVNAVRAGGNHGWPFFEGPSDDPNLVAPIYAYPHGEGEFEGYAVIASAWYTPGTGPNFPFAYHGDYFITDIRRNWMHTFDVKTGKISPFGENFSFVIDVETAPNGQMFVLERGEGFYAAGRLSQISYSGSRLPYIVSPPRDQRVSVGQSATFGFEVSGPGTFRYQWLRDGQPIFGATQAELTFDNPTLLDDGAKLRLQVTNDFGSVTSDVVVLNVTANRPPEAKILTPTLDYRFEGGIELAYSGQAIDPESGELPGLAFTWEAYFVTDGVPRPLLNPTSGQSAGSFTIPTDIAFARADVTILLRLTTVDDAGLSHLVEQVIQPRVGMVSMQTNLPTGDPGSITFEGKLRSAPFEWDGIVGLRRAFEAAAEVTIDGVSYVFSSWSNGGNRAQRLSPQVNDLTLTAFYRPKLSVGPRPDRPNTPLIEVAITQVNGEMFTEKTRVLDDHLYIFEGWEDGEKRAQRTAPDGVSSLVARYIPAAPLVVAADDGQRPVVTLYNPLTGEVLRSFMAYEEEFTGGVRISTGDVNGDGLADVIVGPGEGRESFIRIFDAESGDLIETLLPFERSFLGGVFLAAGDLNQDGFADIFVAAADGGGPRVRIFDGKSGATLADFFVIEDTNFRGGSRLAVADLNGDGVPDLTAVAGPGGGPRIAVYDGKSLLTDEPLKLVSDFFVFEPRLRDGVYVATGDVNGDGQADFAFGGGPGGGPRVMVVDGARLLANPGDELPVVANFFAGEPTDRGGVPVAMVQFDGDGNSDLLTGSGVSPESRVYVAASLTSTENVNESLLFTTLPSLDESLSGGVFVG